MKRTARTLAVVTASVLLAGCTIYHPERIDRDAPIARPKSRSERILIFHGAPVAPASTHNPPPK